MVRKTKAEAERTREQILDAAETVFLQRGVARASLAEIADAAGVTRGAVYWHFRDKTDLFNAMYCRVHLPMAELFDEIVAAPQGNRQLEQALSGLKAFCVRALTSIEQDPRRCRVFTILFHRCEFVDGLSESNQKLIEVNRQNLDNLIQLFSHAQASGRLAHGLTPPLAATVVHSFLDGMYFEALRDPDRYHLQRDAEAMVSAVFAGLLTAGEPPLRLG
ncbi:MAG: TetR family transcriptional regulator [Pseudomonadota bacterium]|nr:TetR family transcriptional regulator [Pseudomonadota bacterium]